MGGASRGEGQPVLIQNFDYLCSQMATIHAPPVQQDLTPEVIEDIRDFVNTQSDLVQ